jgi:ferric-dicitrate binding protein FerR (iron transport regulator)
MNGTRDNKALRAVLDEARAERVPDVDAERIKRELDALPPPAPGRPAPRFRRLLVPAALAAAAALVYFAQPDDAATPAGAAATLADREGPRPGDELTPGTVIFAASERRTVSHPGRVTWTLEPGSRVTLLTTGEIVTVRLDQGSISADVVPSARSESFAVEAGELRVAVHGTVFRVAMAASGIDVPGGRAFRPSARGTGPAAGSPTHTAGARCREHGCRRGAQPTGRRRADGSGCGNGDGAPPALARCGRYRRAPRD